MANIEVYQDADKASRGTQSWTFRVDGQASGLWCPTEHAARRVVSRLLAGRSREAFGGAVIATAGGTVVAMRSQPARACVECVETPVAEMRKLGSGKSKPAVAQSSWRATVDGKEVGVFGSEPEARAACALRAFMTRGKLGRLKEAEEAFRQIHGKTGSCHYDGKSVVLVSESGDRYAVKLAADEPPAFKPLGS